MKYIFFLVNFFYIPRWNFVQMPRGDRDSHLYFELYVSVTFGHDAVVTTEGMLYLPYGTEGRSVART